MKAIRYSLILCFFIFSVNSYASGPGDRAVTDPQSVASVSNSGGTGEHGCDARSMTGKDPFSR
jgi:hypothetical protein